jgi:hypothetical protein
MEIRSGGLTPQAPGVRPDHAPPKPETLRAAQSRAAVAADEPVEPPPARRNLPRGSLVNITV